MGGRSSSPKKSSSSNNNNYQQPAPQDNSMAIWAAEMARQRKEDARQYDETRKQYDEQRAREDAQRKVDEAKREQELWNEKQLARDAESRKDYEEATNAYANQVARLPSDDTSDPTASAMKKKIGDMSKSSAPAPGLTPFGTSVVKPANLIYPTQTARLGGL